MSCFKMAGPGFGAAAAVLLAACGGGGGGPANVAGAATGTLSADITDAAVDDLIAVNLRVTALELRQSSDNGSDPVVVDLTDPATGEALAFDLLAYQNGETFNLFDDVEVPAGRYQQARLVLEAPAQTPRECEGQDPLLGSHVVEDDMNAMAPIFIPSGSNNGVRLVSAFDVPVNGAADIVIDFDLRQALHRPPAFDCYFLRPTYRVLESVDTGEIRGTVEVSLLDGSNAACSDDDPQTGNAVYVYEGVDQAPGDIDADSVEDGTAHPVATGRVTFDPAAGNSGEGSFRVAFLRPGDYTIAFTCAADADRVPDPDAETEDEQRADDDLRFQQPRNVSVEARMTSEVRFAPGG